MTEGQRVRSLASKARRLGVGDATAAPHHHREDAPRTPRRRFQCTPRQRKGAFLCSLAAAPRSRRQNSRTAEKALLHCCTAYCSWGFEGHSSANGGRWAKLSKGYPRSLWWLWCGEVMSQPPTLSCQWLCKIYDITSMTFDPIRNFTQSFNSKNFHALIINYTYLIILTTSLFFTDSLKFFLKSSVEYFWSNIALIFR